MKRGSSGKAVELLQAMLVEHNYMNTQVDGLFGSMTEAAVKNVQKAAGLDETGVADLETQAFLEGNYTSFQADRDSDILMYYAEYNPLDSGFYIYCKNTGKKRIKVFFAEFAQCNASKELLGSFYGDRNNNSEKYSTMSSFPLAVPLAEGVSDYGVKNYVNGEQIGMRDGSFRTVKYFDDARYARITLYLYITEDDVEHDTEQVIYCPFR